ncbi:conserved hypothetical protein [Ricinus communis]|uniref:Mitochondrial transcription termination factor n=1 Tax=Ricinus communis TaxID=3988 RepID=B9SL57_RICCO|nr:conserved hypothetical protein [Ricinus communis]
MISDTHLCKFLRHVKCATRASPTHAICCSRKCPSLLLSSVRCISSKASVDKQSFIVTYLINNCGLSPKSALSASKYLRFKTPHKPDSTLAFLKSHGFSKTQITKVIHTRPAVLSSDPERTLLPKIQFFHSKGFSGPDIAKILSACPEILHTSIENQLIPAVNFIQNLLPSNDKVVYAIKRLPKIMLSQPLGYAICNMKLLKEAGLPESSIVWLLRLTSIATPLRISDKLFLHKFVTPYKEEAPHLLKLYQKKLNVAKCEGKGKTEQKQLQRQ